MTLLGACANSHHASKLVSFYQLQAAVCAVGSYNDIGAADTTPRCEIEAEMAELEEIGEHASTNATRVQNLVYTLPHTVESIAEFLTPSLSRVDPSAGG